MVLDERRHLVGELVRLGTRGGLGVHAAGILRSARASKRTSVGVLLNTLINLVLEARGVGETTLGIVRLEEVLVADLNADKAVGEVGVGHGPIAERPGPVGKDNLDHQHVGDGVTDRLIDEVRDSSQGIKSILLSGRLGLLLTEETGSLLREDNGAVAVGLKVYSHVKLAGRVVKVLDASGGENNRKLEVLLDVVGAGSVGVGSLNNTNAKIVLQTSGTNKLADKGSVEGRNAITVEHEEASVRVDPVVHQPVGIAIERAGPHTRSGLGDGRGALLGLDEVGTALRRISECCYLGISDYRWQLTSRLSTSGL